MKTSILVDTKKKVILGWEISQKTDHKIKHANVSNDLIRQSNRARKSQCYVMDKVYDSEKIYVLIRYVLIREEIKFASNKGSN